MNMKVAAIAAIASLAAWSADAAQWRRVPVPGGTIEDLVVLADGRLYAGTTDGLYRSDDAGDHWTRTELVPSYKRFRKVYPLDGAGVHLVAYTEASEGLDRSPALELSVDGGATWQMTLPDDGYFTGSNGMFGGRFVSHPADPNVVLFADYMRLRRSVDGGRTWQMTNAFFPWGEVFPISDAPGHFIAHSPRSNLRFLESTDFGLSWVERHPTTPVMRQGQTSVVQDALQPERFYFAIAYVNYEGNNTSSSGWIDSRDWSVTLFSDSCDCNHRRIVADPHRAGRLVAPSVTFAPGSSTVVGFPVRESLDGGATWQALSSLERQIDSDFRLEFDPSKPGRSYMPSLGAGVLRSDDDGATRSALYAGMTGGTIPEVSIDPNNPDDFLVARRLLPMLRTTDGGASFQVIETRLYDELYSAYPQRIARSRANPQLLISHYSGSFYRSQDGGTSWAPLASDYPFDFISPNSIDFIGSDSSGLAALTYSETGHQLTYWSSDGGEHWVSLAVPDQAPLMHALQTHPNNDRVYLTFDFGAPQTALLYFIGDGSTTPFRPVVPPVVDWSTYWMASRPDPSDAERRLLLEAPPGTTPNRVWETVDDGTSWILLGPTNGTGTTWTIDACDGRTVWSADSAAISRDNGRTFQNDGNLTSRKLGRFQNFCVNGKTRGLAVTGEPGLGSALLIREPEAGDTLFRETFDP